MKKFYINSLSYNNSKILIEYFEKYSINHDYFSNTPLFTDRISDKKSDSIFKFSLSIGFIFFILSYLFQYWVGEIYYKQNLGGKPFFSLISSLPISLEIAFLSTILTGVIIFIKKSIVNKRITKTLEIDSILIVVDLEQNQFQDLISFVQQNNMDCKIEEYYEN